MIAGRPMDSRAFSASSIEVASWERGDSRPILSMAFRKSSRSSAFSIAARLAPISLTPYLSRTPWSASSIATFSAVWPPMVGRMAEIFSLSIIFVINSAVIGSI